MKANGRKRERISTAVQSVKTLQSEVSCQWWREKAGNKKRVHHFKICTDILSLNGWWKREKRAGELLQSQILIIRWTQVASNDFEMNVLYMFWTLICEHCGTQC